MAVSWVILLLASTCFSAVSALPIGPTPQVYPHDENGFNLSWRPESGLYVLPALALVIAAVGVIFGCTWCYKHKDCKLFTASASQLHDGRRAQAPDSGFSEPANNNIGEHNNNGPISLREMQNIANNNAAAYIVSENEERNHSRESVVEFEPLPPIRVVDPLERCADWFAGEDFPRAQLQYLREIGRGWFGRVVEGEIEDGASSSTVAVRILNPMASLEDKARFLDDARVYRDIAHENVLPFLAKCLQEDPWMLMFELCPMNLQQYLEQNRPRLAALNERGDPLQLMCDVAAGLAHLHSRGHIYKILWSGNVLVRGTDTVRAVVGSYAPTEPTHACLAPETTQHNTYTASSDVWSLGCMVWEVCTWGLISAEALPQNLSRLPPCPYREHLYQVMQLCWNQNPECRPTAAQVNALLEHLHTTQTQTDTNNAHFEERWQILKPNTIPKLDEHVAIVHAPSTSITSQFGSDQEFDSAQTIQDTLSVCDTAVSRSSSIMSDRELSVHHKSDSLNNLHGSFEDVRNIYLTHNEAAALECHQGNVSLEEKEQDRSDSSVDPWLKEIIAGSQDDVSYFKDVSDVIKNLDNILNSEKTSSSESSHQASPSRDNLSLECKKDYPMQTSLVKSPGIRNFQDILEKGFDTKSDNVDCGDEAERDTIGALNHSFERHSDTASQYTLENITPETPIKDIDILQQDTPTIENKNRILDEREELHLEYKLPNEHDEHDNDVPNLKELCIASVTSLSNCMNMRKDCTLHNNFNNIDVTETKSVDNNVSDGIDKLESENNDISNNVSQIEIVQIESSATENQVPTLERDSTEKIDEISVSPLVSENLYSTLSESETIETKTPFVDEELSEHIEDVTAEIHDSKSDSLRHVSNETFLIGTSDTLESHVVEKNAFNIMNELSSNALSNSEYKVESPRINFSKEDLVPVYNVDRCDLVQQEVGTSPTDCSEMLLNSKEVDRQLVDINSHKTESLLPIATGAKKELPQLDTYNFSQPKEEYVLLEETSQVLNSEMPDLIQNISRTSKEIKSINDSLTNAHFSIDAGKLANEEPHSSKNLVLPNEELLALEKALDEKKEGESPETVQIDNIDQNILHESQADQCQVNIPVTVQNILNLNETSPDSHTEFSDMDDVTLQKTVFNESALKYNMNTNEQSFDSTSYMDLTSTNVIVDKLPLEIPTTENSIDFIKNESTIYLDLPSVIKEMDSFLNAEKILSSQDIEFKDNLFASTPVASNGSEENILDIVENDADMMETTKVLDLLYGPGFTLTKLEQKSIPESLSPFESPTKSHHTDTYDENSSVVLGPFENCSLELYKGLKSCNELVDLPKEELLAFSSNFSEMNLETPSPLRDSNFLMEVPDIMQDDLQSDNTTISEPRPPIVESIPTTNTENNTDETEEQSTTERRVSPSTPPNSPGNFLASTSQQKYLVDIDFENEHIHDAVDVNDIEIQMTSKLAIAENENNMNMEYTGPLVEDVLDDSILRDHTNESYLAGNGGQVEDLPGSMAIDEERMKELRNELELKLPLAQVAGIEPTCSTWNELPPPPELIVNYGALSPIAEETKNQLSAYENDDNWNTSVRTESSESYPEPCNNSTDEVTELPPTAPARSHDHSTYTICSNNQSANHTYTLHKDATISKELTMSVDSLNASPLKQIVEVLSPIDDRTYNKVEEDKQSNCERLSQVSPFLVSPTTDTSAPEVSDLNAAHITLSKSTIPTDAKSSKPSETQCLSKATSIDSWCSNDTLYNVEENFDDLAMDPDLPQHFDDVDKSESDNTLTHNEDDKEDSHCSTYVVHDSKSEPCDTFSPDSITANENYTYTKAKTDVAGTTPSNHTKSDLNDSTKNTQTKDLAYGTLMSGMPSFSNCTTDLGFEDTWKLPQPELIRKSPIGDNVDITLPNQIEEKTIIFDSPIVKEHILNKMDSVDISCLQDPTTEHLFSDVNDSPNSNFRDMALTVTSTPVNVVDATDDQTEAIPCQLPLIKTDDTETSGNSLPNFQSFLHSAEIRPQDISINSSKDYASSNNDTEGEGDSKCVNRNSNTDSLALSKKTFSYSDFENSVETKPQDVHSAEKSSQSAESGVGSEDFQNFETSVKDRPQDLSSLIDVSALFITSERKMSGPSLNTVPYKHVAVKSTNVPDTEQLVIINPSFSSFRESPALGSTPPNIFITDLYDEDENEQPHSIIVTDSSLLAQMSPNTSFGSFETKLDTKEDFKESNDLSESLKETINNANETAVIHETNSVENIFLEQEDTKVAITRENEEKQEPNETAVNADTSEIVKCNGSQVYATVNFLNETFEELMESNVDDNDTSGLKNVGSEVISGTILSSEEKIPKLTESENILDRDTDTGEVEGEVVDKSATEDFLQNEKKFCDLDTYFSLLSDIRFTGPGLEIMSTSFTQESPTEPTSPECERESCTDNKSDKAVDLLKEWDSDTDSHSTNSSSGEFIWKDGDGRETSVVPSTRFEYQRDSGQPSRAEEPHEVPSSAGSGDSGSGSGSEGDEVEFVPSSWDCRAAPAKSSLRSIEQSPLQESKKRVVFKRQKYHCVYEYPREVNELELDSPHCLPDLSTYCEWEPSSAEEAEAEMGYGQLFGAPSPLDMITSRPALAFSHDYDEDFFISSSARPFESIGVSSQFFPGLHLKHSLLDDFPPTPSSLPHATPSLDFTTPDSGVEDITPSSTLDDNFQKLTDWKPDSTSSSESVSPSSPSEALGGLRHTRDKLKLDLPPSPHIPSPRHSRVFNFVLDKPKRPSEATTPLVMSEAKRHDLTDDRTPLVMSDETPIVATLSLPKEADDVMPEPTFSTFGKPSCKPVDAEKNIILTDEDETVDDKEAKVEPVKGEGTVLDSGDEDSGIESSSKNTLERKTNVSNSVD